MTILFCKIGWMENYCGQTANDQIQGGGSYVKNTVLDMKYVILHLTPMTDICMVMYNQ